MLFVDAIAVSSREVANLGLLLTRRTLGNKSVNVLFPIGECWDKRPFITFFETLASNLIAPSNLIVEMGVDYLLEC